MDLFTQLGIFSQKKKQQIIYTIVLIVIVLIIIFVWFSPQKIIPYQRLIMANNQINNQEEARYQKAVKYLNMVNIFLENDLPLIKKLDRFNLDKQLNLPADHGRSNPFLP